MSDVHVRELADTREAERGRRQPRPPAQSPLSAELRDRIRQAVDARARAGLQLELVDATNPNIDRPAEEIAGLVAIRLAGRADFPTAPSIDLTAHLVGVARKVAAVT